MRKLPWPSLGASDSDVLSTMNGRTLCCSETVSSATSYSCSGCAVGLDNMIRSVRMVPRPKKCRRDFTGLWPTTKDEAEKEGKKKEGEEEEEEE